jgi:hypothetical protein
MMQPPALRAPECASSSRGRFADEERYDRTAAPAGGVQRMIVVDAQILSKPQDDRLFHWIRQ